jgi:ATP-dependent DNA helicase RecG
MPEHQNIEYKQSWRDEYLKWVCGFANAQGGKIFVGIDDKGEVAGVEDYKKLMDEIPNKAVNHLGLVVDVNLHKEDNKHYIEIDVPVSEVPISYHGIYHYRSGSTKQELKGVSLNNWLLKKSGKSWEDIGVPAATLADLDEGIIKIFIRDSLQAGRISSDAAKGKINTLLRNLRLINEHGELTRAAILLFGKEPTRHFVTAKFKIGRFGNSPTDLIAQDVVEGNILYMADKVLDILKTKYLVRPISYEGLKRNEPLEYPEPALREAILNAFLCKGLHINSYVN